MMIDEQRIAQALAHIPADDRATWIRCGMALFAELGESAGWDVFDTWSRTSERYKERSAREVWRSFRGVHSITIASLFAEAKRYGYRHSGPVQSIARPARQLEPADDRKPWDATLQSLWDSAVALDGTVGALYLDNRNCAIPPHDGDCRFMASAWHWLERRRMPALVSRVTDAATSKPLTLHFTFLRDDGSGKADTDRPKLLAAGYRKQGGVIRLYADGDVDVRLTIAEGIETALVAAHARPPVWACVDAGNLAAFPLLSGIEALLIVADHDAAGMAAAKECGNRWQEGGRQVTLYRPPQAGQDLNDEVGIGRAAA